MQAELFWRLQVFTGRAAPESGCAVYWLPLVDNFEQKRASASTGIAADG